MTSRWGGICDGMRREGYTLDWLQDGASALHALCHEEFDLAILDLGLPRLDGIELLRRLRAAGKSLPVLVLTARDATDDRIAGLDAGADDYLVKPFDLNELKARLRALLRRSSGRARVLIEHAGVCLDPVSQQVHYLGQPVVLTPGIPAAARAAGPAGQGVHPRTLDPVAVWLG